MRIIAKKTLRDFWKRERAAKGELEAWHAEAKHAEWMTPADVKADHGNASILKDDRVVFNICGNKYRLVVWINYEFGRAKRRWAWRHLGNPNRMANSVEVRHDP